MCGIAMPNDIPQLHEGSLIINLIYRVIFKGSNYGCLPSASIYETGVVVSF